MAVEEERTELAGVSVMAQEGQQSVVELELAGHLVPNLVNTVQKLNENRTALVHLLCTVHSAPFSKHVAKSQEILFDQHLEPFECPVVGIDH